MKDNVLIKVADFEWSTSYNLLIELNANSVNYAIVDPDDNSLKALGTSHDSIFSISNNEIFSFEYANILISTITKSFTFVPEVHYNDALEDTFISLLQADIQTEEVFSNFLDHQNVRNIYALNSSFLEKLHQAFSNAKIFTPINPLYEGCVLNRDSKIFVNLKDENFELLILKNSDLVYYNIFEFKNSDEILYFLLLTLQQKELSPFSISVSGNISKTDKLFSKLKNSFVNVELNLPKEAISIGEEFQDVELHQYFSVLSLHLCA